MVLCLLLNLASCLLVVNTNKTKFTGSRNSIFRLSDYSIKAEKLNLQNISLHEPSWYQDEQVIKMPPLVVLLTFQILAHQINAGH